MVIQLSREVQEELSKLGFSNEAQWVELMRDFYHAIDEGGMHIEERVEKLLAMRNELLSHFKAGHFPPPGATVCGLSTCAFEGILGNIDLRLMLFKIIGEAFNQRAPTTLDADNIFSTAKVIDDIFMRARLQ